MEGLEEGQLRLQLGFEAERRHVPGFRRPEPAASRDQRMFGQSDSRVVTPTDMDTSVGLNRRGEDENPRPVGAKNDPAGGRGPTLDPVLDGARRATVR